VKWLAIVPMKRHSARVPGKNLRSLCGKPLFAWVLDALFRVPEIGTVVLDTDDQEVAATVLRAFPVSISIRPEQLRGDLVPTNAVIANVLRAHPGPERILQTHVTNPLLTPETLRAAISAFAAAPGIDSLFSVTRLQTRLYDAAGRAMNHDPLVLLRTQDLPPVYEENSNFYLFTRAAFLAEGSRIAGRSHMFETSRIEALDIDEEDDFLLAEAMMERRLRQVLKASAA
jgi:CMP-N-acetylneuraminic acid synthetase